MPTASGASAVLSGGGQVLTLTQQGDAWSLASGNGRGQTGSLAGGVPLVLHHSAGMEVAAVRYEVASPTGNEHRGSGRAAPSR